MILGLSTRKQRRFFKSFIGDSVSHQTASRLLNNLEEDLKNYRTKRIEDKYENDIGIGYQLKPEEVKLGKQADMFELLVFCVRQRRLGNTNMNEVFSNGVEYLADNDLNKRGKQLLGYLTKIYGGI